MYGEYGEYGVRHRVFAVFDGDVRTAHDPRNTYMCTIGILEPYDGRSLPQPVLLLAY